MSSKHLVNPLEENSSKNLLESFNRETASLYVTLMPLGLHKMLIHSA